MRSRGSAENIRKDIRWWLAGALPPTRGCEKVLRALPMIPGCGLLRRPRHCARIMEQSSPGLASSGFDSVSSTVSMHRSGRDGRSTLTLRPDLEQV